MAGGSPGAGVPDGDGMSDARKILVVNSGSYEDYRETWFYLPADFYWMRVADKLKTRKRLLKSCYNQSPDDVMTLALLAAGCERVPVDLELNIDDFYASRGDDDTETYEAANAFIERLKGMKP